MSTLKFSAFNLITSPTATSFFVGYDGTSMIRIEADNLNTTYDLSSAQSGANVDVSLVGSDATTDTVTLVAGTGITLTDSGTNQITIDSAGGGTPTLQDVTTAGNTTTDGISLGTATAPPATMTLKILGANTLDSGYAIFSENSSSLDLFYVTNSGNFYMRNPSRNNSIIIQNSASTSGTGTSATLIGDLAGFGSNVTGGFLVCLGRNAGQNMTGGNSCTIIGAYAAQGNLNASLSVFIGSNAGRNSSGTTSSVIVGNDAGNGTYFTGSTVIGNSAGKGLGTPLRQNNVYIGTNVANNSLCDDGNTIIGANLQYNGLEALNNHVIIGSYNQERLRINNNGDVTWTGGDYMKIQTGTTASRPASPVAGMIRFNTTTEKYEGYVNSIIGWVDFH